MNIHKSQLFWCELQGYRVLTHPQLFHPQNSAPEIHFNFKPLSFTQFPISMTSSPWLLALLLGTGLLSKRLNFRRQSSMSSALASWFIASFGGFQSLYRVPPKSSTLIGFSIINHPAIGVPPILGNPHLVISKLGWSNDCFPSEEQDFSWKMNVFFDGS